MTTLTLVPLTVRAVAGLTMDDLEELAFKYGGTIERNPLTNRCTLVGAVIGGKRIDKIGPVPMVVAS
ncbi:hypothetical protein [Nocardioides marmoriginsengisoli]|uniref:hypothetical protein n=1 Tax=Nocardioides marmoriginsengisoli TaxID=661483 RepID=UPI0011CE8A3E|nr:hypothetical protein [Nocardioides marmoriginsengisoli]